MTGGPILQVLRLLAFVALGWFAAAMELAPAGGGAARLPAPDLLFCVAAAFAARRPEAAPAALVFGLGLARDALAGGPLGLGAVALLLSVEGVRRMADGRRRRFLRDWGVVAGWAAAGLALQWLGLALTLAPRPPVGELALRLAATAAVWPAAWLAARAALRAGAGQAATEGLRFGRRG